MLLTKFSLLRYEIINICQPTSRMEAGSSSKTTIKDTTQHHIPEDSNLQIPSRHLLLSHTAEVAYSNINHTVLLCILYILSHTFQPYSPPFSIFLHSLLFPTLTVQYPSPSSYTQHKILDRFRYTNNWAVLDCHSSLGIISQVISPWIILILDLSPSLSNGNRIVHDKWVKYGRGHTAISDTTL